MNASSSRSHAVFSLTLTQKKYTGSSSPPVRSSSPLPPTGRSPSRLVRPGSMYTGSAAAASRTSSPTFGRPSTPSFATAMRGSTGGLRPPSSLGNHRMSMSESTRNDNDATEGNDWVTVVSKFHFVDLAGSERVSCAIFLLSSGSYTSIHSLNGQRPKVTALKRVSQLTAGFWLWEMSSLHSVTHRRQNPAPRRMSHTGTRNSLVYSKTPLGVTHIR